MLTKHRFKTSAQTLCAVTLLSLTAGGCSYVERQMREQEIAQQRERHPQRVARVEPNIMRSAPRSGSDEPGAAHSDRTRAGAPHAAAPVGGVRALPVQPAQPPATEQVQPAPAPAAAPARAAPPAIIPEPATPTPPPQPQPRIINPASPANPPPAKEAPAPVAPAPADPLPTQPAPPPPRPDSVPAPPNRANVTPPRSAGGGIVSARPPVDEEQQQSREVAALTPPARSAAPPSANLNGIELARQLLSKGKVLEARVHLQSAVRVSPALALLELARTYDPFYLGMLPSIDDGSEPRRAAALYQEAIVHGSPTAGSDLDRLRQTHPGLR